MKEMKKKIIAEKAANNTMNLYLVIPKLGRIYLFSTAFSKGAFAYFERARSEAEILSFRGWNKNPRLDRIINRLPSYIRYGTNELILDAEYSARHSASKDTDYILDIA